MKKIIIPLACVLILIGGFLLHNPKKRREKKLTDEQRAAQIIDYIETKYNKKFEYQIYYPIYLRGGISVSFYPKGSDIDQSASADRIVDEEWNVTFYDDYFPMIMEPKYETLVAPLIKEKFPEHRFRVNFSSRNLEQFDGSTPFEEFKQFADKNVQIVVRLTAPSDASEQEVKKQFDDLCTEIKKQIKKCYVDLTIYSFSDYQKYIVEDYFEIEENNRDYSSKFERFNLNKEWE